MYADDAENLISAHVERGLPVPEHLIPPALPAGSGLYLKAFYELQSDRLEGGAIPFTAIDCYARRYGIEDPDEFEMLLDMIRSLEVEHAKIIKSLKPPQPPTTG